jgi:hypothetical protein
MTLGPENVNMSGRLVTKTVTIASAGSLSGAVYLGGYKYFTIIMPASWTAANLTFQGSDDGSTFYNLYADGSEVVETTGTAGAAYVLNSNVLAFGSVGYVKIRSGTSATPVAQADARTIKIVCGY